MEMSPPLSNLELLCKTDYPDAMPIDVDFEKLQGYFAPEDIEWRPIAVSKRTGKAMAAAYVTNRAIMDRLDAACGPGNWKNTFQPGPDGGVLCGISIRVGDEWVTKWDGAENTEIHAVKGGLSSSMRRTAVQWGIGRYLYKFPPIWVPVNEHGRFTEDPKIPRAFLPPSASRPTSSPKHPAPKHAAPSAPARPREANGQRPNRQPRKTPDVDQYFPG